MPEFITESTLKIFVPKSFEKEGETIEYNVAYFLQKDADDNESVLIVNTKQDISDDLDKTGTIKVRLGTNGKLSLISFTT